MALYRNVAGFLEPGNDGQIGAPIYTLANKTALVTASMQAQTNAPDEYTTGGPYIIRDFTPAPVATVDTDPSPSTQQNSLPTSITDPDTGSTLPALAPSPGTAAKQSMLPLLTLAGLTLVAIAGDRLLQNKKKIVFVGGLGLLYYQLAKKSNNG